MCISHSPTFTGLKLQGDIGKFGRTDISDIAGYVELPDGKVVSGSESVTYIHLTLPTTYSV